MAERESISIGRSAEVVKLARVLYEEMEHLDPSGDDYIPWDCLSQREVEFYCLCIESIFEKSDLVLRLLAHDNMILGHSHAPKKMD